MSLILEALRRSEAERRRGAPPSLLGDVAPTRARPSSPWPLAFAGLVLGLGLAAAVAWWVVRSDAPPGTPSPSPSPSPSPAQAPAQAPAPAPDAPTTPEAEPPIEPVPSAAYAPLASTPPAPAAPPQRPALPSASATASAATAEPPASALPPAPAPVDAGFGPRDGDLPWSEVAPAAGDALPPLRVSMHVYADDPARRFAIVDGQRRREGDLLQPAMPLLEIRRDGLRIGWQGRVVWVPR